MKTYREFIAEANVDIFGRSPEEAARMDAEDSSSKQSQRRRNKERIKQFKQGTYQKSGETRTPSQGKPFKPEGKPGSRGNTQVGGKPGIKMPKLPKVPKGFKQAAGATGRLAGPALTAVDAALTYKERRAAGESRKRSAAGTATEVGSGLAAAKAGAAAGATLGSLAGPVGTAVGGVVGGVGGYYAGSKLGKKTFDVAAGATSQQKKELSQKTRQRQAGGALVGTGGKTTFDTKKNTMTTGGKTVNLAKTSVVKDPTTGKIATGHLAYKGGQAVYKRAADPSTLAKTSSNPLERIGRTLNPSAYKQSDELKRQQSLRQASASDIKRQQALGVKGSQNLVGPKIVGPKPAPKPKPDVVQRRMKGGFGMG